MKAVVSSQLKLPAKMHSSATSSMSLTFYTLKIDFFVFLILIAYQVSFPFVKAKVECNKERRGTDNQVNSANSDVSN